MRCPVCNGIEHESGARFCHKCGAELIPVGLEHSNVLPPMRSFTVNGFLFNMILVEGGKFWKGSQCDNPSERKFDLEAVFYENPVLFCVNIISLKILNNVMKLVASACFNISTIF